jgi:hypothetical protein
VGYILVEATSTKSGVRLFHDTAGCKQTQSTSYPRLEKHCLRNFHENYAQLVVPNADYNRHHYFSIAPNRFDNVAFTIMFNGLTEAVEGLHEYEFDNLYAKPFKYMAKRGRHTITVTVSNDIVNKCNIYLDYSGCRVDATMLPDMHNNCMMTKAHTPKTCSLDFELEESVHVYFGVETIISETMSVEITTEEKLAFLD